MPRSIKFAEHLLEAKDSTAAAVLVLADVLRQEPVIIEPDDRQTYGVKEAAELLRTSSKKVYQLCLVASRRSEFGHCARLHQPQSYWTPRHAMST